jgi:predicted adenylyl cyclase CyaB
MRRNVEIKAQITNYSELRAHVDAISESRPEIILQEDIFFNCPNGRLKLRTLSPSRSELIFYKRDDLAGPKESRFQIVPVDDPDSLRDLLSKAFGIIGIVRKERQLFMVGQTRIHIDTVDGLGLFLELEVVLNPEQSESYGSGIAQSLMKKLHIPDSHLINVAYIDLILKAKALS